MYVCTHNQLKCRIQHSNNRKEYNVRCYRSSRAELADVREDLHGVVTSRHGHSPSLLSGISVRFVGEDGDQRCVCVYKELKLAAWKQLVSWVKHKILNNF